MNAIEAIKINLDQSFQYMMGMVEDIKDAPLTSPTPKGGNHPLWVVGHVAISEAHLIHVGIEGTQSPLAHWKELFSGGTQPTEDASKYPPMDEVIAKMHETRAHTLGVLASMSEADLDRKSNMPPERAVFFGTVGQVFTMAGIHLSFHAGQIADARQALGRKPVFA